MTPAFKTSNVEHRTPNIGSIFIAGPTAVGKSAVALALAEKIGGEIISVDSMQVYRRLDIGTAKPTTEEQKRIPHHLIDVVELTEPFDAAKFCKLAKKAAKEIIARGRVPIFCGGTGLYFKAYLEGLGEAPPSDEKLRAELEKLPLDELLRELETKDNFTFSQIDKQNPRRVIRAVEVIRLTGKPFSEQRSNWSSSRGDEAHFKNKSEPPHVGCYNLLGLAREREDLRKRIDARVEEMFHRGLVDEVKRLLPLGLEQNKTAMQAIGYRQVAEHLRGERSLPETIELVKIKTRQFAKRQMTWFQRQMDLKWLELNSDSRADIVTEQIAKLLSF